MNHPLEIARSYLCNNFEAYLQQFYLFAGRVNSEYLGKFLGKLSELHHGVSGEVYAVDGRTLHIKDYTYDGEGPGKCQDFTK